MASGHPVGAYGHPWGISYTATRGIVSGDTYKGGESWIQTDAPINKGNSGGPLISLVTGKVVGVSSAMLNEESAQRLNFAVPIEYGCKIVDMLSRAQDPSPPMMPMVFYANEEDQKSLTIAAIYSDDPAFPLKANDEIIMKDRHGDPVDNPSMLAHLLRGKYSDPVPLKIKRGGVDLTVKVQLHATDSVLNRRGILVSGMLISYADYIDQDELNVGRVLMVHSVEKGSAAESLGIERWDLIRFVDGKQFDDLVSLYTYLKPLDSNDQEAHFTVKKIEVNNGALFGYRKLKLPIEQLKMIEEEKS